MDDAIEVYKISFSSDLSKKKKIFSNLDDRLKTSLREAFKKLDKDAFQTDESFLEVLHFSPFSRLLMTVCELCVVKYTVDFLKELKGKVTDAKEANRALINSLTLGEQMALLDLDR